MAVAGLWVTFQRAAGVHAPRVGRRFPPTQGRGGGGKQLPCSLWGAPVLVSAQGHAGPESCVPTGKCGPVWVPARPLELRAHARLCCHGCVLARLMQKAHNCLVFTARRAVRPSPLTLERSRPPRETPAPALAPLISLRPWICLFWVFPRNGIPRHMALCLWPLNVASSSWGHAVASVRAPFPLWLSPTPLCRQTVRVRLWACQLSRSSGLCSTRADWRHGHRVALMSVLVGAHLRADLLCRGSCARTCWRVPKVESACRAPAPPHVGSLRSSVGALAVVPEEAAGEQRARRPA